MAIFTLAEIDEQMTVWKTALHTVSLGQSYRINTGTTDKTLTMADLPEIRNTLKWLDRERRGLSSKRGPVAVLGRPAR